MTVSYRKVQYFCLVDQKLSDSIIDQFEDTTNKFKNFLYIRVVLMVCMALMVSQLVAWHKAKKKLLMLLMMMMLLMTMISLYSEISRLKHHEPPTEPPSELTLVGTKKSSCLLFNPWSLYM